MSGGKNGPDHVIGLAVEDLDLEFVLAPLTKHGSAMKVIGFRVSTRDGRALTGTAIRDLHLGELISEATERAERERLASQGGRGGVVFANIHELRLAPFRETRRGRAGRPDSDYALLAAEYVRQLESGERRPAHALADEFGGSASLWANRISEARKRGLLTETSRGRAGGALTDKAVDLLN